MPCHIALPEISETFGQSGHITHLLAGEAASHTPQVPEPDNEVNGRPDRPCGSSCWARCGPAEVSAFGMLRLAGLGICTDVMLTKGSSR
jgi:hypothetical protein